MTCDLSHVDLSTALRKKAGIPAVTGVARKSHIGKAVAFTAVCKHSGAVSFGSHCGFRAAE